MSTKETGGPAFPSATEPRGFEPEYGMTLRDYFAAKVLSGMVVNGENFNSQLMAVFCYGMADAMLKEREK